jgi:mRNA-degrading endonuclease RelE of RelBE toxin-antitoxin system
VSRYTVYTTPEALREIKRLPGNIRCIMVQEIFNRMKLETMITTRAIEEEGGMGLAQA